MASTAHIPHIYVLAGTNGAGKSSIAGAMLLEQGVTYFNPDQAAAQIREENPHLSLTEAQSIAWRASYTATQAKNEFGHLLEQAIHGTTVVITKHDSPRAVLISVDQFESLQQAPQTKLNALSGQFDALLERMQTPAARSGMAAAFNASPKQLGKAAVKAARKRG